MYASRVILVSGGPCCIAKLVCSVILRYNFCLPVTRQLGLFSMLGLWALLTLIGVLYAVWLGYGGHAFAATLTAFAFLFLLMLLFAARGAETSLAARFSAGSRSEEHTSELQSLAYL